MNLVSFSKVVLRGQNRKALSLSLVAVCFFLFLIPALSQGQSVKGVDVVSRSDGLFDISIREMPLSEALKELSQILGFEIKGSLPLGETVDQDYRKISLDELLRRILRGYNYVLVTSEGQRPLLIVLGKAERQLYTEPPAVSTPRQPPATEDVQFSQAGSLPAAVSPQEGTVRVRRMPLPRRPADTPQETPAVQGPASAGEGVRPPESKQAEKGKVPSVSKEGSDQKSDSQPQ